MRLGPEIEARARDLFSGLGAFDIRAISSGAGLYSDGVLFGLISPHGQIYLKAEGVVARAMAAEGSTPFTFERNGEAQQIGYWRLPETSCESPSEAMLWANRSLDIARSPWND